MNSGIAGFNSIKPAVIDNVLIFDFDENHLPIKPYEYTCIIQYIFILDKYTYVYP